MTVTWKTVAIAAGVSLALGGAGGYLARPQPTVHRVEDDHQVRDVQAEVDSKTTRGPRDIVIEDFGWAPPVLPVVVAKARMSGTTEKHAVDTSFCRPVVAPGEDRILERRIVIHEGATATESHAQAREHAETDHRLDLTITPPARPGWAVQVGTEDLLSLNTVRMAEELRLATRRRLFGPAWAEISSKPLHRCDDGKWCPTVGAALSMEF